MKRGQSQIPGVLAVLGPLENLQSAGPYALLQQKVGVLGVYLTPLGIVLGAHDQHGRFQTRPPHHQKQHHPLRL